MELAEEVDPVLNFFAYQPLRATAKPGDSEYFRFVKNLYETASEPRPIALQAWVPKEVCGCGLRHGIAFVDTASTSSPRERMTKTQDMFPNPMHSLGGCNLLFFFGRHSHGDGLKYPRPVIYSPELPEKL